MGQPPTLAEFLCPDAQDQNSQQCTASVDHPDSKFYIAHNKLLVRHATLEGTVSAILRKVFQAVLFYLPSRQALAVYSGHRTMLGSTRPDY